MLDGWSEAFAVRSTRTTGGKSRTYAITGPVWPGTLPERVTQVKSDTAMVWILGRIYRTGMPADDAGVHVLQDKFSAAPRSAYRKPYTPPPAVQDAPIVARVAKMGLVPRRGFDPRKPGLLARDLYILL